MKYIFLAILSLSLISCGKDSNDTTEPTNNDKDLGKVEYSSVFQVNAKRMETYDIHNNFNCNKPKHGKLTPQQRAEKFQNLCQLATPKAERKLFRKCRQLGGTLENVNLAVDTTRSKFGFCRSLHCEVTATGSCGIE